MQMHRSSLYANVGVAPIGYLKIASINENFIDLIVFLNCDAKSS